MRYEAFRTTDPRFLTDLVVQPLDDGRNWLVREEFEYHTDVPLGRRSDWSGAPNVVEIPVGFVTDFASIPRLFWNIFPPTGRYGKIAVVHDYLYRTFGVATRDQADKVFYEGMVALGVGFWTRHLMFTAVHRFGGSAYTGGL